MGIHGKYSEKHMCLRENRISLLYSGMRHKICRSALEFFALPLSHSHAPCLTPTLCRYCTICKTFLKHKMPYVENRQGKRHERTRFVPSSICGLWGKYRHILDTHTYACIWDVCMYEQGKCRWFQSKRTPSAASPQEQRWIIHKTRCECELKKCI